MGLRHNMLRAEVDAMDFNHFRVRVVDGGGDDVLDFDAATVGKGKGTLLFNSSPRYRDGNNLNRPLVWDVSGMPTAAFGTGGVCAGLGEHDSLRQPRPVQPDGQRGAPAIRSLFTPATAHALAPIARINNAVALNAGAILEQTTSHTLKYRWPYGTTADSTSTATTLGTSLHTLGPEGFYDLPADIFMDDYYTVTGWLENGDGQQISPRTSVTFNAHTIAHIPRTARLFKSTDGGSSWTSAAYTGSTDVRAHVLWLTILDSTNDDYPAIFNVPNR